MVSRHFVPRVAKENFCVLFDFLPLTNMGGNSMVKRKDKGTDSLGVGCVWRRDSEKRLPVHWAAILATPAPNVTTLR